MPHRVMRMSDPAEAGRAASATPADAAAAAAERGHALLGVGGRRAAQRAQPDGGGRGRVGDGAHQLDPRHGPPPQRRDDDVAARGRHADARERRRRVGAPAAAGAAGGHHRRAERPPAPRQPEPAAAAAAVDALAAAGAAGLHTHAGYGKRYVPPPASAAGISLLDHPMSPAAPPGAADEYIYAAALDAALSASERQARADASASAAAACRSNAQKHSHTSSTIFDDLNYPPARLL